MTQPPRRALGRGLDALLPAKGRDPTPAPSHAAGKGGPPASLPVSALEPDPKQPRRRFDPKGIEELAQSIVAQGLIQPIVVAPLPDRPGRYRIVAGERRWRAAKRAGLAKVPVVIRGPAEDLERLQLALVENLQREDLGPVEEARAYHTLVTEGGMSQEEVAQRVGKDRSTVANAIRLLKLPDEVLDLVESGRLSAGHARALLSAPDEQTRVELARKAVKASWSVRATERAARLAAAQRAGAGRPGGEPSGDGAVEVRDLERRLTQALGTRVRVRGRRGRRGAGVLEIAYDDLDALDRILDRLLNRSPGS